MKQEIWLTAERSYFIDIGQDALQNFRYERGVLPCKPDCSTRPAFRLFR